MHNKLEDELADLGCFSNYHEVDRLWNCNHALIVEHALRFYSRVKILAACRPAATSG
jgi:hypothetical protein